MGTGRTAVIHVYRHTHTWKQKLSWDNTCTEIKRTKHSETWTQFSDFFTYLNTCPIRYGLLKLYVIYEF